MNTVAVKEEENLFPTAFKAIVIYDDIGHAARAAAALERAVHGADLELICDLKLWRLEALRQPTQAAICLAVAANANLVALALHNEPPSLEELLDWLEDWAPNRRIDDAAVTLLASEAVANTVMRHALERFAWRHGLAFLDANEAWEDGALSAGFSAPRHPETPAEPMSVASHWGIND